MGFEDWQKENTTDPFAQWQESNVSDERPVDPSVAYERAGRAYDIAQAEGIVVEEANRILNATEEPPEEAKDTGVKRFLKQFYNSAVANVARAFATKSVAAQAKKDTFTLTELREDFRRRYESGEPLTASEIEHYAKTEYKRGTVGSLFGWKPEQWQIDLHDKWQRGELNIVPDRTPEEELMRLMGAGIKAENRLQQAADISADVTEKETRKDLLIDAAAGIAGFTAQVAVLKKVAPSMPEWLVWENVNIANGGTPGGGAAMQYTMGQVAQAFPGPGFVPALQRGGVSSALFGTTTYLGGGDTEDIIVSMGIPFAMQAIGLTKQEWANYKNKKAMIDAIRQKAPALKGRPDAEIEKALADTIDSVLARTPAQLRVPLAKRTVMDAMSESVRNYIQQKHYNDLLAKANTGDKAATKQLNDWVQGRNIPTYEKLLERVYNGDTAAVEQIQMGRYQGGPGAAHTQAPPAKVAAHGKPYNPDLPRTPIDRMREYAPTAAHDASQTAKIDPKQAAKARERGFITSVKEVIPELRINGEYIPRPTDPLAIKARNLVRDNLTSAEKMAFRETTDSSVAVTAELVKFYQQKALAAKTTAEKDVWYNKASEVSHFKAQQLTEAGRFTQAASILSRETPEGQLRFAARSIQKHNEQVEKNIREKKVTGPRNKIPELTSEQTEYILKEMKAIERMTEGMERWKRFDKLQKYVTGLTPTPLMDKIVTTWRAGLLTGVKTTGLNIYSNAGHLGSETIKDIPASVVDKAVGLITEKREVVFTLKGLGKGGVEGFEKGMTYLKTGYSERDLGVKLDYHRVNMGKGAPAKALQAYTEGVFRWLGTQDHPFYYAAKQHSLEQQALASAKTLKLKGKAAQAHVDELLQNPTDKMIKYATKDAEAAIFVNNTALGDLAKGIQNLGGGAGTVIVPFGRTPASVAMQIVNYSPVGAAKTVIQNIGKGRFDQRDFSQGLGRSITGTAVMVIGSELYKAGMITLDRPLTEKEKKLWELEGRQANSIKIGGKWRTVHALGPAGNLLVIGGHFQRAFEENGSPTEAIAEAMMGSAKSFTEQTFLTGVNQFTEALVDPERSATYMAGRTLSTVIPTFVADVARATDPLDRRTETIPEQTIARIPGARQTLEPRITALGEEKTPTGNPLELMIDPTRPSKQISTPVIDELRRLWDEGWEASPELIGDRVGFEPLTQQENTALWKRAGTMTKQLLTQLIEDPDYAQIPDADKFDYITQLVNESRKEAKVEAVVKKLDGLKGQELQDMIFALRKSGLADMDVLPIALSRRNPRKAIREQKQ